MRRITSYIHALIITTYFTLRFYFRFLIYFISLRHRVLFRRIKVIYIRFIWHWYMTRAMLRRLSIIPTFTPALPLFSAASLRYLSTALAAYGSPSILPKHSSFHAMEITLLFKSISFGLIFFPLGQWAARHILFYIWYMPFIEFIIDIFWYAYYFISSLGFFSFDIFLYRFSTHIFIFSLMTRFRPPSHHFMRMGNSFFHAHFIYSCYHSLVILSISPFPHFFINASMGIAYEYIEFSWRTAAISMIRNNGSPPMAGA